MKLNIFSNKNKNYLNKYFELGVLKDLRMQLFQSE